MRTLHEVLTAISPPSVWELLHSEKHRAGMACTIGVYSSDPAWCGPRRPAWANYRAPCKRHVGGCRECGVPLDSGRRAYCSNACTVAFEREHFWGTARLHALRRNREAHGGTTTCVRCGAQREDVPLPLFA